MKDTYILAIETSCDETAAAVVKNGRKVLSNVISSQIEIHQKYGGVVPEIASRKHIENINIIIDRALKESKKTFNDIHAIAVTYGPGLVGALLVGINSAKGLSFALKKPLIAVNHIEGHISANYISHKDLEPPFMSLIVSGGHTHLVKVEDYGKYRVLGRTRDDAAGEAFDKIARSLQLGYPGGPLIDKIAKTGNKEAIDFPRAYLEEDSFDFSFSGLKSAVLNHINNSKQKGIELNIPDIAASFQEAVVEVLVNKTLKASEQYDLDKIVLAGGVASNNRLRELFNLKLNNKKLYYPDKILCTDNAAMIGSSAYYKYLNKDFSDFKLNAVPNLEL
ncbi:MAG: tRNA (adenosine(37)-N6)-threonylcarbamoyltransferase complex transferase subunit TsaD, partial [Tissierellales bacterium]|nr:tRNA (adenosine(37)-N6)-threonylcarbamoyltransferase complex transferase subunit TsaD [Tissierellales bacterium]